MITPLTGHVTTAAANRFACTAHAVEFRDNARDALTDGDAAAPPRDVLADSENDAPPRLAERDALAVALKPRVGDRDGDTSRDCDALAERERETDTDAAPPPLADRDGDTLELAREALRDADNDGLARLAVREADGDALRETERERD